MFQKDETTSYSNLFPGIILFTGQSRVLPSNRGLKHRLENNPKQPYIPIPTDVAGKVRIDT